jgi:hypothetical protein
VFFFLLGFLGGGTEVFFAVAEGDGEEVVVVVYLGGDGVGDVVGLSFYV